MVPVPPIPIMGDGTIAGWGIMDTMLPSAVIVDVLVVIAVMVVVGIVQLAVVNWINQLTKKKNLES